MWRGDMNLTIRTAIKRFCYMWLPTGNCIVTSFSTLKLFAWVTGRAYKM